MNNAVAAVKRNRKISAETSMRWLRAMAVATMAALVCVFIFRCPAIYVSAGTGDTTAANTAITNAVKVVIAILKVICLVVGGFLLLFGIVKTIMAHAQDNASEQNKALVQAASGLALVIMGIVLLDSLQTPITKIIENASSVSVSTD